MEYCSALKRNELLTHGLTRMNLENMMLNEISQTQEDKYCRTAPTKAPGICKFVETGSVIDVPGGRGSDFIVSTVPIGDDEEFCKCVLVMVAQLCMYFSPPNCTLENGPKGKFYVYYVYLLFKRQDHPIPFEIHINSEYSLAQVGPVQYLGLASVILRNYLLFL